MEIQETKAYSIPFINIDQNSTLMFEDEEARDAYFDAEGDVLANNVVKDVWRLYVDYLMTEGTPYPKAGTYNYFRFKLKRGGYLFFYVYDYEVKGAGQILYKLKLDSLQTYYLNTNKFQTIGEQLVYREHKDRFNENGEPIIDQTLESLDIKPRIVEHVKTYPQREAKLALTKIGGGVKDGNILSKAMYFWKVHSMFPLTNNLRVNNQDFELMLGWGVSADTYGTGKTMRLTYIPKTRPSFTLTINFNEQFTFGYGNVPNKNYKGLYIAGDKTWENRYTVNPPGNTEVGFTDVSYTTDKKWIYFVEDGRLFIDIVTSNFDFRINYDMGIDGYDSSKTFIKRIYNGGMANPFGESQLTESALETQQIISIPDITMLDLKGFGTNGKKGIYIPLNQEINEKIYDVENDVTNLTPSFTTTFSNAMTRVKYNDPKLLHSQFNTLFFTLQNEQIPLKLENTNNDNKIKLRLNLNNSNYSKALLTLENASKNMLYNELYELEKVINMNNEHVVIKSEINEYIDLHAKNEQRLNELQINKAERDLVYKGLGQVVSIGGGVAAGAISGSIVPGVGTVAGAVAGAATGIVKGALNIAQGIQNLNQLKEEIKLQYDSKIKSLAYSLINVTGLSPDLAQKQELNKLKLFQFKLLDYEKDYLDLYFHNFGYQTLEYKIPNLRSRKYFNFIQMELVNYHINNRLITDEIIEDIKSRFRTGVTLFHYNEEDSVKIDTQKQYENFERIFETLVQELFEAKVAKKAEFDALLDTYTEADYSPANWAVLTGYIDAAKAEVDSKTVIEDVEAITTDSTKDLCDAVQTLEQELSANVVRFVSGSSRTITPKYTNSGITLQYSVDSGATWITISSGSATTSATEHWFRGRATGTKSLFASSTSTNAWAFSGSSVLEVYGNLNYLLCDTLGDEVAPTSLATYAYAHMFRGCTSLTVAPELPATTLANSCYSTMFYNCTSLTAAPELPATTVGEWCYVSMFRGCTSLTTAPELPATTLASYCYLGMFYGCTSFKVSATNTGSYTYAWRIPTSGTGTTATNWNQDMLEDTGGTFTGAPNINTTYYVENEPV